MMPRLSVLMAVHNGEPWVAGAIESVLAQTFADFEFLVVNDGSTDSTGAMLDACRDPRLRVMHQARAGLTHSLNRAFRLATASLVARMDADDVALPDRFASQVEFLEMHPEVGLLGAGCQEIAASGAILKTITPPASDHAIRRALIRENPFIHSSIMMRREVLEAVGLYDESLRVAQDYDLWLRMSRLTRMANLTQPLVQRRLTPGRVSSTGDTERLRTEVLVKFRALRYGAYPFWCAIFLARPLCALAMPPMLRRLARRVLSRYGSDHASLR